MSEIGQLLELWDKSKQAGQPCVLATVVKTQGSSYRLPGARLLLTPLGERAGSISGGCLEDDLVKRAWWLTEPGPLVRRYDTTPDGEIAPAYGLGCNGIIHVLLERITPDHSGTLELLQQVRATRTPVILEHVIEPASEVGTRLPGADPLPNHPAEHVFVEHVQPPLHLLVCGAGDDAIPLCRLAQFLGWQVSVYDGRAHYARRERFPEVGQVSVYQPGVSPLLPHDAWTVAVVMTHSYSQDLSFLSQLSPLRLPYLGILGPRHRTLQMLEDAGLSHSESEPLLHAPMGLDIGADGPEQVALSVVAEIQGALNRRGGGQLRHRSGSIHAPSSQHSEDQISGYRAAPACV